MENIIFQYWEESERGWGIRPDGCSIHRSLADHKAYVDKMYKGRGEVIPNEYDRVVGDPMPGLISQTLSTKLFDRGYLRISEVETNNLIRLEDIII